MGKVIGILVFVLGIWAATQYAAGESPFGDQGDGTRAATVAKKSGAKVQAAYEEGNARRDALLPE